MIRMISAKAANVPCKYTVVRAVVAEVNQFFRMIKPTTAANANSMMTMYSIPVL